MTVQSLIDMDYPLAGAPVSATPPAPRGLAPLPVRPIDYDPRDALPPGLLLSRDVELALIEAWIANGFQPLTPAQAVALLGVQPVFPSSLRCLDDDTCTGWWRELECVG